MLLCVYPDEALAFPPSALDRPPSAPAHLAGALAEAVAFAVRTFPFPVPPDGWRLLAEGSERALFASGPATAMVALLLRRGDDGWAYEGIAARPTLLVFRPGLGWATWTLAEPAGAASTRLEVEVRDGSFTDTPLEGRLLPAEVVEDDEAVTISWFLRPGSPAKAGVRPVHRTVELGRPLGDRQLLDGTTFPPSPVAQS